MEKSQPSKELVPFTRLGFGKTCSAFVGIMKGASEIYRMKKNSVAKFCSELSFFFV
jgi:hypothetical protein